MLFRPFRKRHLDIDDFWSQNVTERLLQSPSERRVQKPIAFDEAQGIHRTTESREERRKSTCKFQSSGSSAVMYR